MKRYGLSAIVALLLIAGPVQAQSTVGVVGPAPIAQLEPGDGIRALWNHVVGCAGKYRDTTQTFEGITFYLRDTTYAPSGKLVKGAWSPPGNIYLTVGFETQALYIAHEMMHHALNGPRGGDPHYPAEPWITCGLMERQQEMAPLVREVMETTPPAGLTTPHSKTFVQYRTADPLTNRLVFWNSWGS